MSGEASGADTRPYLIYALQAPNGREYVGLTSQPLKTRWANHRRVARNRTAPHPLYDTIRKYGPDSFCILELDRAVGFAAAQAAERHWIATRQAALNVTSGGEAGNREGMELFWVNMKSDPAALSAYKKRLSAACKARGTHPSLAARAQEWRGENSRIAWYASYRAIRLARSAQRDTQWGRDPRFCKWTGRLWLPKGAARKARKSYASRKTAREQWATRDQTLRLEAMAKGQARKWVSLSETERAARLAQLAAARAAQTHSEEVKERRREGIRRYWAKVRAEKAAMNSASI